MDEIELDAARSMRLYAVYNLAAFILEVIGSVLGAGLAFALISPVPGGPLGPMPSTTLLAMGGIVAAIAVFIIAVVVALFSLYYLVKGFREYCGLDSGFCMPYKLTKYGLVGGLILMFIGLLVMAVGLAASGGNPMTALGALAAGGVVLLVALVLAVIGGIASLVGLWRFGSRYDNGLVKASVILYLLGALAAAIHWVGGLLSVVALVLLYMGATEISNSLSRQAS